MSAPPGWYPDPAGRPGHTRLWDGRQWSAQTRPPPTAPPPVPRRRSGRLGWLLLIGSLVAVLVLVIVVVRQIGSTGGDGPFGPGGSSTTDVCPPEDDTATPQPQPADGRVHGGRLSYPRLGAPFGPPTPTFDVPFGRGVVQQFAEVERGGFLGFSSWGAAVLVGELNAGDGFYAPEDGAEIVMTCVTGTFYGDTEVTRDDQRSQAITVDGYRGWLKESNLGFDIPDLQAKHELLVVVVVDLGDGTAGLFCASVPENAPQLVAPARQAMAALEVR